jgi:hypothetical protein
MAHLPLRPNTSNALILSSSEVPAFPSTFLARLSALCLGNPTLSDNDIEHPNAATVNVFPEGS